MVVTTPTQHVLIFSYETEADFRFHRIREDVANEQLLNFGRAINSLQREHANHFSKEVRSTLEDSYANS